MSSKLSIAMTSAVAIMATSACGTSPRSLSVERPIEGRLNNGLRYVLAPNRAAPTVAIQIWYQIGSRDEVPEKTGLAHLFEHMMFKKTKTLAEGEFDRVMESLGAEGLNAFTDRDYTVYTVEVPSASLETVLKLEADRMENLIVDEQSFKTELEIVKNERRERTDNSSDGLMDEALYELVFKDSSYRWPIVGYAGDLESMKVSDSESFFLSQYRPERAIVVIVGDFSPRKTIGLMDKWFSTPGLNSRPGKLRRPPPEETPQLAKRKKTLVLDTKVELLQMGIRVPAKADPESLLLTLASQILANGKSSRLYRALVATGIASNVSAAMSSDIGESILRISVALQPGKTATTAEQIIFRELSRFGTEGPHIAELTAARNKVLLSKYIALAGNESKAEWLGSSVSALGSVAAADESLQRIEHVRVEQIKSAAQKWLIESHANTIVGIPKK